MNPIQIGNRGSLSEHFPQLDFSNIINDLQDLESEIDELEEQQSPGMQDRLELSAAYTRFNQMSAQINLSLPDGFQHLQARMMRDAAVSGADPVSQTARFGDLSERINQVDPELMSLFLAISEMLYDSDNGDKRLDQFMENMDRIMNAFTGQEQQGTYRQASFRLSMNKLSAAVNHAVSSGSQQTVLNFRMEATRIEIETDNFVAQIDMVTAEVEIRKGDPLVLDLDGDGIELTDVNGGVLFDIDADGTKEQSAFVHPDDGLLAMDRNGNGHIDSTAELFGDRNGAANGFMELAGYDTNQDQVINSQDTVFNQLYVFRDTNQNGISESDELTRLSDHNISELMLNYQNTSYMVNGNSISQISAFRKTDNSLGMMGDVYLNYLA